jgi:hypothetical protein
MSAVKGKKDPVPPRVSVAEFFSHFEEKDHEQLRARLIDHGRLLAWTGNVKNDMPFYVVEQSVEGVIGEYNGHHTGPAPGYDRIAFYCEREPPVTPGEVLTAYGDSDLLQLVPPYGGEPFDQWRKRCDEEGCDLEEFGDTLALFLIRELGEEDWTYNDRGECIRRVEAAVGQLTSVLLALQDQSLVGAKP